LKDTKVEKYKRLGLGYLPVAAVTIRQTFPPTSQSSQSLTLELLKGEHFAIFADGTNAAALDLPD